MELEQKIMQMMGEGSGVANRQPNRMAKPSGNPDGPSLESKLLNMMGEGSGHWGKPGAGIPDHLARQLADQRKAAWDKDNTGSERGFDNETLQMLIDRFDGEGVHNTPASLLMPILLRGTPSEDESAFFDALSPDEKMRILEGIVGSDGLGNISSFMEGGPADKAAKKKSAEQLP